jgi:hypothetical protein
MQQLLENRIITPGVERIATEHSPYSHPGAFDSTVPIDRLIAIVGA